MTIPIQFDPFNFALSTMLMVILVVELLLARNERRGQTQAQIAPA